MWSGCSIETKIETENMWKWFKEEFSTKYKSISGNNEQTVVI